MTNATATQEEINAQAEEIDKLYWALQFARNSGYYEEAEELKKDLYIKLSESDIPGF